MRQAPILLVTVFHVMAVAVLAPDRAVAEPAPGYYALTVGLEGDALADALQAISARGHRPLSYKAIWTLIQKADEDPLNAEHVLTVYSRRSLPKVCMEGAAAVSASGPCAERWNREHVWAKSHGFPNQQQWAHTDGHHLRAELTRCNAIRGNLDFGDGGVPVEGCSSRRSAAVPRTWEPPDEAKGDVARMMFYMAVRYDGDALLDRTPDLQLVDKTTKDGQAAFGKLCTLLRWHEADPVSDQERQRNDVVQQFQGNRNPFVDMPELASRVWAARCSG